MALVLTIDDGTEVKLGKIPPGFGYLNTVLLLEKDGKVMELRLNDNDVRDLIHMLAN